MNVAEIDSATRLSVDLFLARIAGGYPIAEAWLYGSRARGDFGPESDADLAIILHGPEFRATTVATEMAGAEFDVMLDTGVLVSALPIWIEDWREPSRHANPWLLANIRRHGVVWHS